MNDQSGDASPSSPSASAERSSPRFPGAWLVASEPSAATPLSDWEPAATWATPARAAQNTAAPAEKPLDHQQILLGMARVVESAGEPDFEPSRLSSVGGVRPRVPAAAAARQRPFFAPSQTTAPLAPQTEQAEPPASRDSVPVSSRFILADEEAVSRRIAELRRSSPALEEEPKLTVPGRSKLTVVLIAALVGALLVLALLGVRALSALGEATPGALVESPAPVTQTGAASSVQTQTPPLVAVEALPLEPSAVAPPAPAPSADAPRSAPTQAAPSKPAPAPASSAGMIVRETPF